MAVKSKTKQRRNDIEIAYFKWEFLRRNSEYRRDYSAFDQKFGTWIREHGRYPDMKDTSDGADIPHTVVSADDPKVFKSKVLDTDEKFSYTFAKAGTSPYFCSIHPKMTGKVVVQ